LFGKDIELVEEYYWSKRATKHDIQIMHMDEKGAMWNGGTNDGGEEEKKKKREKRMAEVATTGFMCQRILKSYRSRKESR